nr:MAG TPA: hypothetical protein [Caudoviricetes sp.]
MRALNIYTELLRRNYITALISGAAFKARPRKLPHPWHCRNRCCASHCRRPS